MSDKIEKMTDDDFKKIMQHLGMPESHSLLSALKQVENHTWQAAQAEQSAELERLKHCRELLKKARDDVEETLHYMRAAYRDSPRNKTRLDNQFEFLKQIDAAIAAEGEKE